jgi:hypothetical protein
LPQLRIAIAVASLICSPPVFAQQTVAESLATVRVAVRHENEPIAGATVRAESVSVVTDASGAAILRLPPGRLTILALRLGFAPDSATVLLRAGQDTSIVFALERRAADVESVIVSATRAERRVDDIPLRVEVIDEEEVAEKAAMRPGDIAMMLNDVHRALFSEASAAMPRGRWTTVAGGAVQRDQYRNDQRSMFDFRYDVPSLFAQLDLDATTWLVVSASGRVDWHSVYGTSASPRVSALLRAPGGWTTRLSTGPVDDGCVDRAFRSDGERGRATELLIRPGTPYLESAKRALYEL